MGLFDKRKKKQKEENKIQKPVAGNLTKLFLFSREDDLEVIMDTFYKCFGITSSGSTGNTLTMTNNMQSVNICVWLPYMDEHLPEFIANQKNMVSGHFACIQDCDEDIKINFIHHIQQCKAFIDIEVEYFTENEEIQQGCLNNAILVLLDFLEKADGILLVDDGTAALNAEGNVILSDDGRTQLEYYFPFAYMENPPFLEGCTPKQLQRRNENMKYYFGG